MGNLINQQFAIWDTIMDARDEALMVLNEHIQWTFGLSVQIMYRMSNQIYIISATGVDDGCYIINYDTQVLEDQIQTLYTTKVNMNGEQYHVLNDHDDEEISNPFNVQELFPTAGN